MTRFLKKFLCDESGVTSVEYALLAAAASVVVGAAGTAFYGRVSLAFAGISLSSAPVSSGN